MPPSAIHHRRFSRHPRACPIMCLNGSRAGASVHSKLCTGRCRSLSGTVNQRGETTGRYSRFVRPSRCGAEHVRWLIGNEDTFGAGRLGGLLYQRGSYLGLDARASATAVMSVTTASAPASARARSLCGLLAKPMDIVPAA